MYYLGLKRPSQIHIVVCRFGESDNVFLASMALYSKLLAGDFEDLQQPTPFVPGHFASRHELPVIANRLVLFGMPL